MVLGNENMQRHGQDYTCEEGLAAAWPTCFAPHAKMPLTKTKKRKSKKEPNGVEDPEDPGVELGELPSRRQSESREPLTPEPQDIPPQKKKKKKKVQTPDLATYQEGDPANQPELVNGDGVEHHTDGEEVTRKTKRKKKSKTPEMHYSNELSVEDDDIITDVQPPIPQHSLFSAPLGHSQPVGKVFVERSNRLDLTKAGDPMDDLMEVRPLWTTRDVALRVHSGFSCPRCPTCSSSTTPWPTPPSPCSTCSSLSAPSPPSTVYFAALILSLSQQMTSDRINLYPTANETLWPPGSEHQILQPWIVVNLVVALFVGLAWVFVSTRPEMDYTEEFLMAMEVEEYPRMDEKAEIPA
ncbi:hypothetical protein JZ751_014025 [Albula glossodonta]|uniref:Uncharacterized protein n=1 Tax=Albula glossodonta TaxID=121402 RepID=A0A8T2N3A1_9TELE|nr:hypothetical protein JZ751_014025 [Albula glossodonta]